VRLSAWWRATGWSALSTAAPGLLGGLRDGRSCWMWAAAEASCRTSRRVSRGGRRLSAWQWRPDGTVPAALGTAAAEAVQAPVSDPLVVTKCAAAGCGLQLETRAEHIGDRESGVGRGHDFGKRSGQQTPPVRPRRDGPAVCALTSHT